MAQVNVGSISLPDAEVLYLMASVAVNDTSLRSQVAEAVKGWAIRLRNVNRDRIEAKAREHGLDWETAFKVLAEFGNNFTEENIEAAKAMPTLIDKSYGQTNLGNEAKS